VKLISLIIALTFCLLFSANAQTDTLVITLKNKQVEKIAISQIQKIKFENVTAVEDPTEQQNTLSLKGNFPNPFGELTNIEFEIETAGAVEIFIYDNSGKIVQKLNCTNCPAGKNSLQWNCMDISNNKVQSGMYHYEVRYGGESQSKKMIIIK
jgi:flagellar hook assembly protein FlgD